MKRTTWQRTGILVVMAAVVASTAHAQVPPRSVSFPKDQVSDEFFAYLMGIFYGDHEARVSGRQLVELLPEFADGDHEVPLHDIEEVRRYHYADQTYLAVDFNEALRFPAPVDILGYHPAYVETTRHILLQEVYLPSYQVDLGRRGTGTITSVRVFRMIAGTVRLEFAEWVDRLFGELIENVDATMVITLRFEDRWYGVVGALEPDGDIITGVVDLTDTSVRIRPPRTLRSLAEEFMVE